jgi:hypothetical protein
MKAYVFPGQGAQFPGMGKDLYEKSDMARDLFETANSLLGFRITDLMFTGTDDDLKQTKVTQPSVFLHLIWSRVIRSVNFLHLWQTGPYPSKTDFSSYQKGQLPCRKHVKGLPQPWLQFWGWMIK